MKFGAVPTSEAEGAVLAHKLYDSAGKLLLNKGRILTANDIDLLHESGHESIIVADLEENDLHENIAARRVGEAIAGDGIEVKAPGVGRANLMATVRGPLRVNVPALERLNNIYNGITIATLREHTLVNPHELLTLVKIIPFAVPEARVIDIERVAAENGSILSIRPLQKRNVVLIISGPESAKEKLITGFHQPVKNRIEHLGSELLEPIYVPHNAAAIANIIRENAHYDLILVASVSAIIDSEDIVPTSLALAGGSMTHFGVPVDPGTLLMLGYIGDVPVVGAPGCIKSPKTNVIDYVLPRLLAGERLTHADMVSMGHGGLLNDILERPMPREVTQDVIDDA
jgi:molybdenum cofactor cytidylyltransferase